MGIRFITVLALVCSISSCIDIDFSPGTGCRPFYWLEIPLSVIPAKSVYIVGDTIRIEMVLDNTQIVDLEDSTRLVRFPNFDPLVHFRLPIIDTFPVLDGLVLNSYMVDENNFAPEGQHSKLTNFISFITIDTSSTMSKLGFEVVLLQRGTYALYTESLLYDFDNELFYEFPDRCGKPCCSSLTATIKFNNGHTNSEILNATNLEVEKLLWQGLEGTQSFNSAYYFRVE